MKRLFLGMVMLVVLLGSGGAVQAGVCDLDARPAATLLLPFFEVDTVDPDGINTVFSIGNALPQAVLAHVTVWTDLSVPVIDYNVYLTGYDMEVVDLGQMIRNGILPRTASDGQDPTDTISPQGAFSQDINFSSCNGQLPLPNLPAIFLTHLKSSLTGQPSVIFGNRCAGRALGDNIARGYVTVDVVSNCTLRFPYDPGYFGPGGDALDLNALFGDYTVLRGRGTTSDTLVHIEADANSPETSTPGQYTFYGRYVGWNATDHREPLPTTFGVRYTDRSDLVVWRDSKVNQQAFTCPAGPGNPSWNPLGQELVAVFDLQENPVILGDERPFPVEAQRVRVGSNALPAPAANGWIYLNLNTTVAAAGANPPEDPAAAQAWVSVIQRGDGGGFVSGHDAVRFDNACQANHDTGL